MVAPPKLYAEAGEESPDTIKRVAVNGCREQS